MHKLAKGGGGNAWKLPLSLQQSSAADFKVRGGSDHDFLF